MESLDLASVYLFVGIPVLAPYLPYNSPTRMTILLSTTNIKTRPSDQTFSNPNPPRKELYEPGNPVDMSAAPTVQTRVSVNAHLEPYRTINYLPYNHSSHCPERPEIPFNHSNHSIPAIPFQPFHSSAHSDIQHQTLPLRTAHQSHP